jgi:hypothetical protein
MGADKAGSYLTVATDDKSSLSHLFSAAHTEYGVLIEMLPCETQCWVEPVMDYAVHSKDT